VTIRTVTACGLAVACSLALARPAAAQTPRPATPASTTAASSGGEAKGDYSAGLNLGNWVRNRGVVDRFKIGWNAGASFRITHLISVIGEANGDYLDTAAYTVHRYEVGGGARFQESGGSSRVSPFLQIVLGTGLDNQEAVDTTNHYPVVSPGGGVDIAASRHAALRLRADFPLYMTFGDVFKGARISAGLSIPFGKR